MVSSHFYYISVEKTHNINVKDRLNSIFKKYFMNKSFCILFFSDLWLLSTVFDLESELKEWATNGSLVSADICFTVLF